MNPLLCLFFLELFFNFYSTCKFPQVLLDLPHPLAFARFSFATCPLNNQHLFQCRPEVGKKQVAPNSLLPSQLSKVYHKRQIEKCQFLFNLYVPTSAAGSSTSFGFCPLLVCHLSTKKSARFSLYTRSRKSKLP